MWSQAGEQKTLKYVCKGKAPMLLNVTPWRRIGGVEVYLHALFYLGTIWRWAESFTPRQLYPQGKSPLHPLGRGLGGPQSRYGRGGEVKNSHLLQGLDHPTRSPALYYWVILVRVKYNTAVNVQCTLRLNTPILMNFIGLKKQRIRLKRKHEIQWPVYKLNINKFLSGNLKYVNFTETKPYGFIPWPKSSLLVHMTPRIDVIKYEHFDFLGPYCRHLSYHYTASQSRRPRL
jgi:hypothetical protein